MFVILLDLPNEILRICKPLLMNINRSMNCEEFIRFFDKYYVKLPSNERNILFNFKDCCGKSKLVINK